MAHNGEINTLRGNINWMRAREGVMKSKVFGKDLEQLFPIIEPDCSDSGNFDNVLEFLLMNGRTLPEAMMIMIPEAWQKHNTMDDAKKSFYEYQSTLMEPWDGPASIVFTNGRWIGAILDRNGLRPSRYYLTADDRVIMASEVGVLPIDPERIRHKGRLQPGRMFLVDFKEGRLVPDLELKRNQSQSKPYAEWLKSQRITIPDLQVHADPNLQLDANTLLARLRAFGYTRESIELMLIPLVTDVRDPIGSMGNDSALACLSDQPRMLYEYFRQLFAQVTNPAIDSIREDVIMSLACYIGPEGNLLDPTETNCHRLLIDHPILTNRDLNSIRKMDIRGWRTCSIDITFNREAGSGGVFEALNRFCSDAEAAVDSGYSIVILSDRNIDFGNSAVSMLLAASSVHQHLVRKAKRTRIGLVVETGEASEVHHHCLLLGYGVDAINPYLAFEALWQACQENRLPNKLNNNSVIVEAYRKGVAKGILKVMGKMGISTLQSYKGAQIFEAVGLKKEVIDYSFSHTASRIEGVGFDVLGVEMIRRHELGYPSLSQISSASLPNPGEYHWRPGGRTHGWEPDTIVSVQRAALQNDTASYQSFANSVNSEAGGRLTLRGMMSFNQDRLNGIEIDEVEPAANIVRRFCTGAMSFGSISPEAHETLAIAMNRLGGRSNTGEGGEDPERFYTLANGDSKRSSIKQVASGRFGVTAWYLTNADEIQIKISQGAKPGEGGELPGLKVDGTIARVRYSTPGVGLISPPPHHDIYSIEDLAQLIYDLKNTNPLARISVKLVSEVGVGTIAAGVAKAHADQIVIAGDSGGTGASPLTSIKHAGLPWELGIAETHQTLVMNDLRSRVVLQTDGGMKTGRDVVIAALLGAEEIGFSTAPLITLGCIMMRKCHLNTCPVGIATQDPVLRKKFHGKPDHVVNYFFQVAEEVRSYMARLGVCAFEEMIGRVDFLETQGVSEEWKVDGLDLSAILQPAQKPYADAGVFQTIEQQHGLDQAIDRTHLIRLARPALDDGKFVHMELPISNTNRTVGTMLSHEIVKIRGEQGLPDGTIHVKFSGSAGQSFGAWLVHGVTLELEGDANDYVGKGLSGGQLIVYPSKMSGFIAEQNMIVGNVVLYGATSGAAFFRGMAAERFCIRNSGAIAVVEGLGDHGCEYMTGGTVVVLGSTGRNFAAGMSGGIAYVLAPSRDIFEKNCNPEMVNIETVLETDSDVDGLKQLIQRHFNVTASTVADRVLDNWGEAMHQFVRVIPTEYQRIFNAENAKGIR
jgi:glutamate synthase (NADPH/NADH) large chain